MNNVSLVGRLTADPEMKEVAGKPVASFSVAVDNAGRDSENKDNTSGFFNCEVWGKSAEFLCTYFKKGSVIGVNGELQHQRYKTAEGAKASSMRIIASRISFIPGTKASGENTGTAEATAAPATATGGDNLDDLFGDQ